jgi:hypothetical protein
VFDAESIVDVDFRDRHAVPIAAPSVFDEYCATDRPVGWMFVVELERARHAVYGPIRLGVVSDIVR